MLEFQQLSFCYPDTTAPALVDVSCTVAPGSYVVMLGANGSGKTTLARLANGLLLPESGAVIVDGLDSSDILRQRELRQLVGLVSQDPDEQIVSTTVLDEVAFGPENLGLPPTEIATRAQQSLAAVGLLGLSEHDPNTLSGGQKQRLVLAGILAMHPRYLVMDEPTAMLDSAARNEFMNIIDDQRSQGRGILHITHDLTMAAQANSVLVLCAGKLVFQGPPAKLLAAEADLVTWQLKT
ncbi:MAG: ATP-binding cassette domain-containing protein, partial [Coriobacteriales bacterium]|nr:ATP-binding cassette domain-containing protein [Coriobacteriales bacterium]